ncbi:MAG: hypothetical protein GTO03_14130 [Planctomycetales bacterium]|nr:hypothetical protein [Planctomycetales bacterium]
MASVPFVMTLSAGTAYAQGGSPASPGGSPAADRRNLEATDQLFASRENPFGLYADRDGAEES